MNTECEEEEALDCNYINMRAGPRLGDIRSVVMYGIRTVSRSSGSLDVLYRRELSAELCRSLL